MPRQPQTPRSGQPDPAEQHDLRVIGLLESIATDLGTIAEALEEIAQQGVIIHEGS